MSLLPPIINDSLFDTINKKEAAERCVFDPLIQELHRFLNDLPCLEGLQEARHRILGISPTYPQAFGAHSIKEGHWYTFNHGGRDEMQFNIGMSGPTTKSPGYLRVGLAWNFYGPSRRKVNSSLESFRDLIASVRHPWDAFVNTNRLEIEWRPLRSHIVEQTPTNDVTEWLFREPFPNYEWILIGRLLRRNVDTITLADPNLLKSVIESVFSGFLPLWEKTQHIAHARDLLPVS